jgi:hypothetical protein
MIEAPMIGFSRESKLRVRGRHWAVHQQRNRICRAAISIQFFCFLCNAIFDVVEREGADRE